MRRMDNVADDPPWAPPLSRATRRGHSDIEELLRKYGAPLILP